MVRPRPSIDVESPGDPSLCLPCDDGEVRRYNARAHEERDVLVAHHAQLHHLAPELGELRLGDLAVRVDHHIAVPFASA